MAATSFLGFFSYAAVLCLGFLLGALFLGFDYANAFNAGFDDDVFWYRENHSASICFSPSNCSYVVKMLPFNDRRPSVGFVITAADTPRCPRGVHYRCLLACFSLGSFIKEHISSHGDLPRSLCGDDPLGRSG